MNTDLTKQTNIQEVLANGSQILEAGTTRVNKALEVGNNIINTIKVEGMSAQLDERCNKYLVNCRNAASEILEARKPITQYMDSIKKQFTGLENKLDPAKADTIPFIIQNYRNNYVKQLKEEEDKKRLEAENKANKEKEAIEISTETKTQFSNYIKDYIADRISKLQNSFNNINLENFETKSTGLESLKIKYEKSHFEAFYPSVFSKYHTPEESKAIITKTIKEQDFNLIEGIVVSDIEKFKNELIEKLPGLKLELEKIAKADADEKNRLEAEKAQREAAEQKRLNDEAEAAKLKAAQELEDQKLADQTNVMMDATSAELFQDTPEARSGYEIKILHQGAFVEIFNQWFREEGVSLTFEEIEKKSIAQMKTWCEKNAHKTGEKIVSKYLKYEPVYKAVNRK